jgi:transposase
VVSIPRTRPPYPEQFRREAVELVRTSGCAIKEIASDLGVTEQSLRTWVNQHESECRHAAGAQHR